MTEHADKDNHEAHPEASAATGEAAKAAEHAAEHAAKAAEDATVEDIKAFANEGAKKDRETFERIQAEFSAWADGHVKSAEKEFSDLGAKAAAAGTRNPLATGLVLVVGIGLFMGALLGGLSNQGRRR